MILTSPANPTIKAIRKLRDRKAREQSGLFLAEGLRLVIEAVQQGAHVETLVVCEALLTSPAARKFLLAQRSGRAQFLEVSEEVFRSIALKDDPAGAAAVIRQEWAPLDAIRVLPGDLWVALHEVADPGNLGTIQRTLDAVGGKGIILLGHATDPYDPSAVRASMGALFNLKLVKATPSDFASWKNAGAVPLVGAAGSAEGDYQDLAYPPGLVLLMGSEREGLPDELLRLCDHRVRIPMVGRSDSLNLAVATAVALYEIFNQKRRHKGPV